MRVIAIILARGGSKGVPRKNLIKINNIPLLSYTIRQCKDAGIKEIYTSSNDQEILEVAQEEGSNLVFRPNELSSDFSTSTTPASYPYTTSLLNLNFYMSSDFQLSSASSSSS